MSAMVVPLSRARSSHPLGDFDAERRERFGQLTPDEIRDEDEDCPARLVALFEYAVLVAIVEEVESLRQLKRVLGEMRRLGRRRGLRQDFRQTRRERHERPDFASDLTYKDLTHARRCLFFR